MGLAKRRVRASAQSAPSPGSPRSGQGCRALAQRKAGRAKSAASARRARRASWRSPALSRRRATVRPNTGRPRTCRGLLPAPRAVLFCEPAVTRRRSTSIAFGLAASLSWPGRAAAHEAVVSPVSARPFLLTRWTLHARPPCWFSRAASVPCGPRACPPMETNGIELWPFSRALECYARDAASASNRSARCVAAAPQQHAAMAMALAFARSMLAPSTQQPTSEEKYRLERSSAR
jgi:hypothetical protein